jgi:hypothetical protein
MILGFDVYDEVGRAHPEARHKITSAPIKGWHADQNCFLFIRWAMDRGHAERFQNADLSRPLSYGRVHCQQNPPALLMVKWRHADHNF